MASNAELTRSKAEEAVEAVLQVLKDAFARGENIELRGFGCFKVVRRRAKKAQDISIGKTIVIPEHNAVKFQLSNNIKKKIK